jgi:tRNA(Ile2) C34 agmatinyltransferase TiaS
MTCRECGGKMTLAANEVDMICPDCGHIWYFDPDVGRYERKAEQEAQAALRSEFTRHGLSWRGRV